MALMHCVLSFMEQVASAVQMHDLGDAFQGLAEDLGYRAVGIVDAPKLTGRLGPAIVFITQPKNSVQERDRHHPLASHARFAWAQGSDTPIFLDDLGRALRVEPEAWQASLPPHIRDQVVLVLPVHREGRLVWYIGCMGPKPDRSPLAVSVLHMAANVALDRFEAIVGGQETAPMLTRQEAACLRWIRVGKTDNEISAIIGIAPRTVRFHVGNAKRKLGVRTRLQAVAARLNRGLERGW